MLKVSETHRSMPFPARKRVGWLFAGLLSLLPGLLLSLPAMAAPGDPPPGRLVDVGGYRLHIYCQGHGSPTVIMDSGLGGSSLEWEPVQQRISKYTRACWYDRAGYGWSDPGPSPRDSEQITSELRTLLRNADIPGPYVLVGHSFGGYIAQLFAKRFPTLTAGVVLVDSSHPEQVQRYLAPPIGINTAPSPNSTFVSFKGPPHVPAHMPAKLASTALWLLSQSKDRYAVAEEYMNFRRSAAEVEDAGPMPPVPLMVVTRGLREWKPDNSARMGKLVEDLWRRLQDELASESPRSAHIVANHSGHHIHLDQPQLVADAISMIVDFARPHVPGPLENGPLATTWLAFNGGTWLSDRLHVNNEAPPAAMLTATLFAHAGHIAGRPNPAWQRIGYWEGLAMH